MTVCGAAVNVTAVIVMPNGLTVAESVLPQIANQYTTSKCGPLLLGVPAS
jgi:hypothetical protein